MGSSKAISIFITANGVINTLCVLISGVVRALNDTQILIMLDFTSIKLKGTGQLMYPNVFSVHTKEFYTKMCFVRESTWIPAMKTLDLTRVI